MRNRSISSRGLAVWLAGQMAVSSWGADIPATSRSYEGRLAIMRVGDLGAEDSERAYRLVERRMQRWLENREGRSLKIEPLPGTLQASALKGEADRARLEGLLESPGAEASPATLREVEALIDALTGVARHVPSIQKALIWKAEREWHVGRRELARKHLEEAARLHPDRVLPDSSNWEGEQASADRASFSAAAIEAQTTKPLGCVLQLAVSPPEAEVSANGFPFTKRREFLIPAGTRLLLSAEAPGREGVETAVACSGVGRKSVSLSLPAAQPDKPASIRRLSELSLKRGGESLCLIEPKGDEFKLYLYTPTLPLDEIPLRAPLRVADVLQSPSEAQMPILSDAFGALLERHLTVGLTGAPEAMGSGGTDGATELDPERKPRWYNSSTFWWVVGGVAGGVLLTVLLSRGGQVGSQNGLTIRFE